ncbi:MAG TPA: hypothetical protein VHB97_07630 [Polyangia bacterium]|nr:hypothetical protein [Polyangia bacterium]
MLSSACLNPPVESPVTTVVQDTPVRVPQNEQNQIDVLFMVDNSPSMDAMQTELKNHFSDFFQVFQDLATQGTNADLHIGVVTSDYGAGDTAGGGCSASPGGQNGLLQALGAAAATGCQAPTGAPYIEYAFQPNGAAAKSNLPAGQDLVGTFTCMASVGAAGCGFEHQLESVRAALVNTKENAGFLRDQALLAVVFVTNEDDGSAAPQVKFYESSADVNTFGAYDTYRQTQFAVYCGGNAIPYGMPMSLSNCTSAPNLSPGATPTLAYDISRYTNMFTQPSARGGIKTTADDVILFAIDGPETPVSTALVTSGTGLGVAPNPSYVPCGALGTGCVQRLNHVCQNNVSPPFFADPSVRLNAVVNSAKFKQTSSICGDDLNQAPDFTSALQALGKLISSQISPGCIPATLTDLNNPECIVEDVTENPDGTETITSIPACSTAGAGVFPCWTIAPNALCNGISPQGVGMSVNRNGVAAPANTNASVECSTIAQ